jgi:hypothetical protein
MTYRVLPERAIAASAANEPGALSTPLGATRRRVLHVAVAYSGAPTQDGVSIDIDSGAGAEFDTVVHAGAANARYTFWQPAGDLVLLHDDALKFTAPAGGGGITSHITIVTEAF